MESTAVRIRRDSYLWLLNLLLSFPGHAFRHWVFASLGRNQIGRRSYLERRCRLSGRGGVVIGNHCNVNSGVLLDGRGGLFIGDRVNISQDVLILTDEHDPMSPGFADRPSPVHIESRVWLATRVIVLPGARVGEGVVVAAGAVVRGRLEPNTVTGGIPARKLGTRSPEAQTTLPPYKRFLH